MNGDALTTSMFKLVKACQYVTFIRNLCCTSGLHLGGLLPPTAALNVCFLPQRHSVASVRRAAPETAEAWRSHFAHIIQKHASSLGHALALANCHIHVSCPALL